MAKQLTTEQLLLLNNLMYMNQTSPLKNITDVNNGTTIGEVILSIDINKFDNQGDYGTFMTVNDWKNIITAVKNDDKLMSVQIVAKNTDENGGTSVLFSSPSDKEAIVVYRGTAGHEWKDNFEGGAGTSALDGVSTQQQERALDWYDSLELEGYSSITVTGHSKGGNKAKYVTIMDESVDRCVSFDGQGFSDEFMEVYKEKIEVNQSKIENNNAESDYVNFLLNDIGETNYYKGFDYGEGLFLENHAANTMMHIDENGNVIMIQGERDPRIETLDEFINSYLRSIPKDKKGDILALIGELAEQGANETPVSELISHILNNDNIDDVSNLLAYLLKYKEVNPELIDAIKDILTEMGYENICSFIDIGVDITEWKYFDELLKIIGGVGGYIPDYLLNEFCKWIKEKYDITLSADEIKTLFKMIQGTADQMEKVEIKSSGLDIKYKSLLGKADFYINIQSVIEILNNLENIEHKVKSEVQKVDNVSSKIDGSLLYIKPKMIVLKRNLENSGHKVIDLRKGLEEIINIYSSTELRIVQVSE